MTCRRTSSGTLLRAGYRYYAVRPRTDPGSPPRPRSCGDPRERPVPAGLEWPTGPLEIQRDRCVVGGDRRPLPGFAIDLGPDDIAGHRRGRKDQVDPHALVAMEHPGTVVPPRDSPTGRLDLPERIREAPL